MSTVPQTKALKITGLDNAPGIPVGARVTKAYWVLAENYGPGEKRTTEAAAIRAGILRHEQRQVGREVWKPPSPEAFSVDLRWEMRWEQGAPDVRGGPTASSGIEFTVRRTHYESIAEAEAHIDRLERVYPDPESEPMPVGAMLDKILARLGADVLVEVRTAADEVRFDLTSSLHVMAAVRALTDAYGHPYVVTTLASHNTVLVRRR